MTKQEIIQEIRDEASRRVMNDTETDFVIDAKIAESVVEELDIE